MNRSLLMGLSLVLFCAAADAQDNYTNGYYPIDKFIYFSKTEPVHPNWAGFVELTFSPAITWAVATSCSATGVAIRNADTHLIAAATSAAAMGRNVRLFVDDAQSIDGVCILRAIQH